jgi:hypothetical protein
VLMVKHLFCTQKLWVRFPSVPSLLNIEPRCTMFDFDFDFDYFFLILNVLNKSPFLEFFVVFSSSIAFFVFVFCFLPLLVFLLFRLVLKWLKRWLV